MYVYSQLHASFYLYDFHGKFHSLSLNFILFCWLIRYWNFSFVIKNRRWAYFYFVDFNSCWLYLPHKFTLVVVLKYFLQHEWIVHPIATIVEISTITIVTGLFPIQSHQTDLSSSIYLVGCCCYKTKICNSMSLFYAFSPFPLVQCVIVLHITIYSLWIPSRRKFQPYLL